MKKAILILIISTILFSCNNSSKFKFDGNLKTDMGPNFGMPSTLIITKNNENYSITLDNKSKEEVELLPYNSIYKRK